MIEQIEVLEHHTNILTNFIDIGCFCHQIVIIYDDYAASRFLQFIQTAQECTLPGAGRPDETNYFAFFDFHIDVLENLQTAKAFFQVFNFYLNQFASLLSSSLNSFVKMITST